MAAWWRAQEDIVYAKVSGETLVNEQARLRNILEAFDRLISQTLSGDTAIVYLSGHGGGVGPRRDEWGFLPHDFESEDSRSTALSATALRQKLGPLTRRGATVVLLIDACFSGGLLPPEGVIVLASSRAYETSLEHGSVTNGLFTNALLEAMRGSADTNGDGVLSLEEIESVVVKRVPQLVLLCQFNEPVEQKPTAVRTTVGSALVLSGYRKR